MRLSIIIALILASTAGFTGNKADAKRADIALEQKVKDSFSTLETLLNKPQSPEKLLKFLHESVDDTAKIRMTVSDEQAKETSNQNMVLDKAQYINSYLLGPRHIENYRMHITDVKIQDASDPQMLMVQSTQVESGRMLDLYDYNKKGPNFKNETTCVSVYTLGDAQQAVLKDSACTTKIIYEQET